MTTNSEVKQGCGGCHQWGANPLINPETKKCQTCNRTEESILKDHGFVTLKIEALKLKFHNDITERIIEVMVGEPNKKQESFSGLEEYFNDHTI